MRKVKNMKKEMSNPDLLLHKYVNKDEVIKYLFDEMDKRLIYLRYSKCRCNSDRLVNQINDIVRLMHYFRTGILFKS